MGEISRDIFRAVHEGKWLSIEYRNKDKQITKYWIGIIDIDLKRRAMTVEGLHLSKYAVTGLNIYIDSIISSAVIDGSFFKTNERLVNDIAQNPHKYRSIFTYVPNLKVLNYLEDCSRLDSVPYLCDYSLIKYLDRDCLTGEYYELDSNQFKQIVTKFQYRATNKAKTKRIKELCVNVLSINMKKGLYVLAYRRLSLDVINRRLVPAENVTVCREFTIDGEQQSIRFFLDEADYCLLEEFELNQELIKDKLCNANLYGCKVDDMPYIVAVGIDLRVELSGQYSGIMNMYREDKVTYPVKAFFGELTKQQRRRKDFPIALLNRRVNLDQLMAINSAMKYRVVYVQGPPGTGKTNTIINTIVTAYFNERTVLFASHNNHPIDGVCDVLTSMTYKGGVIPFPILRLGNNDKVGDALDYIREIYERTADIKIYDSTLSKNKDEKITRTRQLTALLKKYEEILYLRERQEAIESLLNSSSHLTFRTELEGRQLYEVEKRLSEIGEIREDEALSLIDDDSEEFAKYMFYTSARYVKKLDELKYKEILDIAYMEDKEMRVVEFNRYLSSDDNLKKLLKIFPIVATTCISAHKLGEPKPNFDMVIMDEASQCNSAMSLLPVIRGENLMLVGDPQQLNPVILLDSKDNQVLRKRYHVPDEYDYVKNSIYKTYLSCDSVSNEILLSCHYRCHPKIIEFNNKKYYNGKLRIKSEIRCDEPLILCDVEDDGGDVKNTSVAEAQEIVKYVRENMDKRIGIITPFANQKNCISALLKENGLEDVACGTVHSFQGDEKDVILFSLAVTGSTRQKTYDWLKNNRELLNVAVSRARDTLVLIAGRRTIERLHQDDGDDVYELVEYVGSNGTSRVTEKTAVSRALGIKPYSTETEEEFLASLNHAIDNILFSRKSCVVHKEVAISHVFKDDMEYNDLFYTGRFDFVVYERSNGKELPIFAIELDGKEHFVDEAVMARDHKKAAICRQHGFELIRIENSYARRYNYIKDILIKYFKK